jgi:beta-glucanase (GH16 family)
MSLGGKFFDDPYEWHTYGLLWTSGTVEAYYDGKSLGTVYANPGSNNWAKWPYDQNYYIILNLAMGGTLGGAINSDMKRAEYDVDYVRVYKAK